MESAVQRILVLSLARRAHREALHRSIAPIVRQGFDNAEAWPAICAVGKRIKVTAIRGIENLAPALLAGRNVGHDQAGFWTCILTRSYFKTGITSQVEPGRFESVYRAAQWLFGSESALKNLSARCRAFDFNENALTGVAYPSGQPQFRCKPIYKWPKTDTLNRSPNRDSYPFGRSLGAGSRVHICPLWNPAGTVESDGRPWCGIVDQIEAAVCGVVGLQRHPCEQVG